MPETGWRRLVPAPGCAALNRASSVQHSTFNIQHSTFLPHRCRRLARACSAYVSVAPSAGPPGGPRTFDRLGLRSVSPLECGNRGEHKVFMGWAADFMQRRIVRTSSHLSVDGSDTDGTETGQAEIAQAPPCGFSAVRGLRVKRTARCGLGRLCPRVCFERDG